MRLLASVSDAVWYRRSLRVRLLVVLVAMTFVAALVIGGVTTLWQSTLALAVALIAFGLAAIAVLYVLSGRALEPLRGLARGLRDLQRGDYQVRLARPTTRELAAIADRFNKLAATLHKLRSENKRLAHRLVTAQDDERRRMALELRDEVEPSLAGLEAQATSIATIAGTLPLTPEGLVRERADELLAIIEYLQARNRALLDRLGPTARGDLPLGDLLSALVRDRARQHPEASFSFRPGRLASGYGDAIDLTVYRFVQEGLANAIRHAKGAAIEVELGEVAVAPADVASRLELAVKHNGRGLDRDATSGFVLRGMQERVQALGGTCVIEGAAGQGTCVRITIPVPRRADDVREGSGGETQ
jgi:two-component system, NarL family, sensor histidine kinase UhpB